MSDIRERAEDEYFNHQSEGHQAAIDAIIVLVIEECARVAQLIEEEADLDLGIADALRALRDR